MYAVKTLKSNKNLNKIERKGIPLPREICVSMPQDTSTVLAPFCQHEETQQQHLGRKSDLKEQRLVKRKPQEAPKPEWIL